MSRAIVAPDVLLVAYQCAPEAGSVSRIGWEWYARLCAGHRLTLVTHVRNRAALEAIGAPLGDSRILYIDSEWFAGPLYRLARRLFPRSEHSVFLVSSLDYFVFDFVAYRLLRRLAAAGVRWSVLHRVTPVTLAAPTWLGRLGVPMVLGPLNSGLGDPPGFAEVMRQESTRLTRLRGATRFVDALLGSSRRAQRILTATRTTLEGVARRHRPRCRMIPENAVDLSSFPASPWPRSPGADQPLRVLYVGRLVPVKGVDLLLHALARLRASGRAVLLEVIGDGPLRDEWTRLAASLDLAGSVNFRGAQPTPAVAAAMQASHVFCLPSLRESGGAVLLEAMACARPVIALDYGGPAEIVGSEVGVLVALTSREQVVADLAATLDSVCTESISWQTRGENGRRLVEQRFSWPARIAAVEDIYREIVEERRLTCSSAQPC